MAETRLTPEINLDGVSLEEAFSVLGDQTRLDIIRSLWKAGALREYDDLIDFGIWREMDADITDEENKQQALKASLGAIEELQEEGIEVEWVSTDVLEDPESDSECAYCHYRAPSEEAIKEHSERAGLPVTKLTRMDDQLDKETAD